MPHSLHLSLPHDIFTIQAMSSTFIPATRNHTMQNHVRGERLMTEFPARTFTTLSSHGLRHDILPMRLYHKAKRLGIWDPRGIDRTGCVFLTTIKSGCAISFLASRPVKRL